MSGSPRRIGRIRWLFGRRTTDQSHGTRRMPAWRPQLGALGCEQLESRLLLSGAPEALTQQLMLDPDLNWSTYLSGSLADSGSAVAVDSNGNVLVTGSTTRPGWASGGFDTIFEGTSDAFVAKLTPDGDLLWSTYLGGSGSESGHAIAIDAADNILITGETGATVSPNWISGGFDTTHNGGVDAFVVKLGPAGEHIWGTYLGGSGDDSGLGIAVDSTDSIILTGSTLSSGWVEGGFGATYHAGGDGFVAKLSTSGDHTWSTYLGGSGSDTSRAIAVDSTDNIFIAGTTSSAGWALGGFDTTLDGNSDAFAVKLSANGQHLWTTYLGGGSNDSGYGVAVDRAGNVLVGGWTGSTGWVSDGFATSYNGGSSDAFVVKLSPTGTHIWSTYVGGSGSDLGLGIAVDANDNALVTGYTSSPGWVWGGFDSVLAGSTDAFVVKLGPTGIHRWSTYLGGDTTDSGRGIASGVESLLVVGTSVLTGGTSTFVGKVYNPPPMVVGRHVFYNGSVFDGASPLLNPNDEAAVAIDKTALLPGEVATFANYTSYSRGINGVMIDITDLADMPTSSDFEFRVGNDGDPDDWLAAPAPTSLALHIGAGLYGTNRIVLAWADGAIKNTWLQVTVKATTATGLQHADVFYFGNSVGESGDDPGGAIVNATDELGARNHVKTFLDPAAINDVFDFNRDGFVNATDQILARSNSTTLATALKLITVPGGAQATAAGSPPFAILRERPTRGPSIAFELLGRERPAGNLSESKLNAASFEPVPAALVGAMADFESQPAALDNVATRRIAKLGNYLNEDDLYDLVSAGLITR